MKNWILGLSLVVLATGCTQEPEFLSRTECAKEETRDVQICSNNTAKNAVLGAAAGAFGAHLLGFKKRGGALIGGALGAANGGETRCYIKQEKHCTEYRTIQEPNPRYKKP